MRFALLVVCLLVAVTAIAQEPANLIANGDFTDGTRGWGITLSPASKAVVVDAEAGAFAKALRLDVKPDEGAPAYAIQMMRDVNGFIEEGDALELKLWMRGPNGMQVNAFLQIPIDPWSKPLSRMITLTDEWTEYTVAGPSDAAYAPGDLSVGLHLGYGEGTIEMTGIRVTDLNMVGERERPTVDQPINLVANGDLTEDLDGNWSAIGGDKVALEIVDAQVDAYTKAARLTCSPDEGAMPWSIQFGQAVNGQIYKGDAIYFRAWLRSPDECEVSFIYEMGVAPHSKYISQAAKLTPEWQEYRFMGRAGKSFQPNDSQAKVFLGHGAGVVEIAGIRVENYAAAPDDAFDQTIDFWGGREHPDDWREPALARIEEIRKGDVKITVVDADGNPVPDASVKIEQQRHAFRFGTAAPAGRFVDTENPDNVRFQQEVARLYNVVTFENDLKFAGAGPGRLDLVDRATAWLLDQGISVRGHCLLWGSYKHLAPPYRELRGDELLEICEQHVRDYAKHMAGKLYLWDVVNEAGSNTELWEEIGWDKFADSFRWAREADPNGLLAYNDYGILALNSGYRKTVAERIQLLLDEDVPLDVLGLQAHMSTPLTPMHSMLEVLDEWAKYGKRLEITEFDLGCQDDETHAEYLRDFMTAAFSHPSLDAFIMWGFWEGSHWRSNVGGHMFRMDWSKRPAQDVYESLVLDEWWTDEEFTTGADGEVATRAFLGKHKVTVTVGERTAEMELELTDSATFRIAL